MIELDTDDNQALKKATHSLECVSSIKKEGLQMIDFSNAKILDLAVHVVGNKSKDEELVLTDTSSTISNDVTEQYIKEYFFS